MAKFYGPIGYSHVQVEVRPGVWEDTIVEYSYFGDVIRNSQTFTNGISVHDDISLGHSISIMADAYAREHISAMRYVRYEGVLWKIVEVEQARPRLILRLGGVYNGPTP